MKRSTRLEKFAELNVGIENNAGALLATVQKQYDKQNEQLGKLQTYREEYQQQLDEKLQHSRSATAIHDYHKFIASLNQAITQQSELVRQWAVKVEVSRRNWLLKKQDVTKMTRAAENLRLRESVHERRKEQKETDEMSLNRMVRSQQADNLEI